MAWLEGWNNRVPITIDPGLVSGDEYNYPLVLRLSDSEGSTSVDLTPVIQEVRNKPLRIAVTTDDEETECQVQVNPWYYDDLTGIIGITVPLVSSLTDTILYLYFDYTHSNNTDFVSAVSPGLTFNSSVTPYIEYGIFQTVKHTYKTYLGAYLQALANGKASFETTNGSLRDAKVFLSANDGYGRLDCPLNLTAIRAIPVYKFYYFQHTQSAISEVS